jgi:hypothetical protein
MLPALLRYTTLVIAPPLTFSKERESDLDGRSQGQKVNDVHEESYDEDKGRAVTATVLAARCTRTVVSSKHKGVFEVNAVVYASRHRPCLTVSLVQLSVILGIFDIAFR